MFRITGSQRPCVAQQSYCRKPRIVLAASAARCHGIQCSPSPSTSSRDPVIVACSRLPWTGGKCLSGRPRGPASDIESVDKGPAVPATYPDSRHILEMKARTWGLRKLLQKSSIRGWGRGAAGQKRLAGPAKDQVGNSGG